MVPALFALRQQMDHADRNWEPRTEIRIEVVRERVENRRLGMLLFGAGWSGVRLDRFVVPVVLARVVVVVAHVEDVHGGGGAPDAVFTQLFEFEALAVFATDVHQEGVVGNAEYSGRLTRRHFLVPYVLEGFGQFGVGPRTRRAPARRRVLPFWSTH